MTLLRRVLALLLFVALLVAGWQFADSNGATVTVDYLVGDIVDVALWRVLLSAFGLGVLVTGLALGLRLAAAGLAARRTRKELTQLESEVHQLRNLPLSESERHASPQQALVAPGSEATVNN
jgi:uncharacterized integral membrane protein